MLNEIVKKDNITCHEKTGQGPDGSERGEPERSIAGCAPQGSQHRESIKSYRKSAHNLFALKKLV
jgi:hypothetical protein